MSKISKIRILNTDYLVNDLAAIHYYDTFSDLVTDAANLVVGDLYVTTGFYTANDGGFGEYIISDTQDATILQIEIATGLYANLMYNDKISIKAIGAYCDGTHDDSSYIQKALNYGTPLFPNRQEIVINNTVKIRSNQKIIDFNMCYLNTTNNSLMFLVNEEDSTNVIINVTLKNAFVRLTNGGSFLKFHDCYFTTVENIRITGLTSSYTGIEYDNGFNHLCKNVNITGKSSEASTISENNAIGIKIKNQTPTTDASYANMTNISIEDCLIQICQYGIKFESENNAPFDTTSFTNLGFSYCDFAIYANTTNANYNLNIDTIRAEYCDYMLYSNAFVNIGNIYCYRTNKPLYNITNIMSIFGSVTFFGVSGKNIIESNTGKIDFSGVVNLLRNNYGYGDLTGLLIPSNIPHTQITNVGSFDRLKITTIPITQNLNFSTLDFLTGNGNICKITGSGTIYNLPNSIPNISVANGKCVMFRNNNGTLEIIG